MPWSASSSPSSLLVHYVAKLNLACCADQQIEEYWHEHDACDDPMCYAQECMACGKWETLCGMTD